MDYETAQVATMLAGARLAGALDGLMEMHDLSPFELDYLAERVRFLTNRYREEVAEADRAFAETAAK